MPKMLYALLLLLITVTMPLAAQASLTIEAETAGISGFRAQWDTPILTGPDGVRVIVDEQVKDRGGSAPWDQKALENGARPAALAFDAIHRTLLVRFPGAAEQIAARLAQGAQIDKVEILLPFADEELWPWGSTNWCPPEGGYIYRANWNVDKQYRQTRPTWHAIAHALRQPWQADAAQGPTYNAYIHGAGYWARFGAQDDTHDRFPHQYGPTPVNHEHPAGRMDVTALVTGETAAGSLGERLRLLSECGFSLRKWETYDHRYFDGVYEWATATGGRAIIIQPPSLQVTFKAGAAQQVQLPAPREIATLAATLAADGKGGQPTAVMPSREELKALAQRFAVSRPEWMPVWQFEHVQDLLTIAYGEGAAEEPFWINYIPNHVKGRYQGLYGKKNEAPADGWVSGGLDPEFQYWAWIDDTIGKQYRGWHGFEAARVFLPWFVYREAMPAPVHQWYHEYWTAWLMPERETAPELFPPIEEQDGKLIHPMFDQLKKGGGTASQLGGDSYFVKTGDWQGNKSFYRSGFNYTISTTNFNNTASMGALLGGAIIGGERAIADGRHGQANFPLKLWTWHDGSTQEEIDDYYFGVTVKAQKMIRDFGPTPMDQLIGASQLLKSMTMLVEAYHPNLRRYVVGASRTAPHYRMGTQEGLYGVLHTLSEQGAYTDMADPGAAPYEKFGREFPPAEVAQQAAISPFAPIWYKEIVDHKPLPFELTATFKQWGSHDQHPIMRRTWLGENYGVYSANAHTGNVPLIAHWRREARVPELTSEVGTLWLLNGINDTFWGNHAPGWRQTYGQAPTLQHRNKLVVVTSPAHLKKHQDVRSIQGSIALFSGQTEPTWQLFIDGKPAQLPATASAGQRITLRDGVTYIGIVPLPATDLGRDAQVRIAPGVEQTYYERYKLTPSIVIDNFYRNQAGPLDPESTDWQRIARASGGFVVEFGDVTEYGSFEAFQKHLADGQLTVEEEAESNLVKVSWKSGDDLLEMGAYTNWPNPDTSLDQLFAYQRVNGGPAYLPEGVERDSSFAIQATTGHLEKHDATLRVDEGRLAVLQAEPRSGSILAANPLAVLTRFSLSGKDGFEVTADGLLGLTIVTWAPADRHLDIQHSLLPEQLGGDGLAQAVLVFNSGKDAQIRLNGEVAKGTQSLTVDGRDAVLVPLGDQPIEADAVMQRYQAMD